MSVRESFRNLRHRKESECISFERCSGMDGIFVSAIFQDSLVFPLFLVTIYIYTIHGEDRRIGHSVVLKFLIRKQDESYRDR